MPFISQISFTDLFLFYVKCKQWQRIKRVPRTPNSVRSPRAPVRPVQLVPRGNPRRVRWSARPDLACCCGEPPWTHDLQLASSLGASVDRLFPKIATRARASSARLTHPLGRINESTHVPPTIYISILIARNIRHAALSLLPSIVHDHPNYCGEVNV